MNNDNLNEIPLLTFNSLYNLLREEKKTRKLQNLPDLFYESLGKFLEDKKLEIEKFKNSKDLEKLRKEKHIYTNTKKMAIELVNVRSIKISNISIKNQLFGENVLDEQNILEKEREFYMAVQSSIKKLVKNI